MRNGSDPFTNGQIRHLVLDILGPFLDLSGTGHPWVPHGPLASARRGFQKQHNDRCVTVFSASNYCGDGGSDHPDHLQIICRSSADKKGFSPSTEGI